MRSVNRSPKTATPKNNAVTGSSAPRIAVGVEPMRADGPGHRDQRNDRREKRQRNGVDPHQGRRDGLQIGTAPQPNDIDQRAENQTVEGEFLGRKVLERRAG